jgi:hypothetical protein
MISSEDGPGKKALKAVLGNAMSYFKGKQGFVPDVFTNNVPTRKAFGDLARKAANLIDPVKKNTNRQGYFKEVKDLKPKMGLSKEVKDLKPLKNRTMLQHSEKLPQIAPVKLKGKGVKVDY